MGDSRGSLGGRLSGAARSRASAARALPVRGPKYAQPPRCTPSAFDAAVAFAVRSFVAESARLSEEMEETRKRPEIEEKSAALMC